MHGPASGRQATFRAGTEGVRLDVLVTDKGHPVTGLRGSDFEILDNGVDRSSWLRDDDVVRAAFVRVLATFIRPAGSGSRED